ncbi:hypothetical protein OVA24_09300 [Luteolibacter sp. SL250]|uniref:Calx-beta domain-containing protein n=1 Tax=Luteolibacter sp. SL250 TaxID=2995170 RepID=UPI00226FC18B|nr:Calx-beta domain-containing protein [Luteolibacter sp. SL250]WAC21579.1 hypothetical protein OVA24_09300 [Luteolibacter sp. SL250]
MKSAAAFIASAALVSLSAEAGTPRDFAVDLRADVSDTAPHIILSWTVRIPVTGATPITVTTQRIHRRPKGANTWTLLSTLTTSQTSYTDTTAVIGESYEYWLERRFSSGFPNMAVGYISAGVKVPEVHSRGILLLAIDDTMVTPLAAEIALLKADLAADGWTVKTIVTPRTGTAITTKALIKSVYDVDPANTKSLYLLGRVPIPYSGNMAPDGHSPDHVGAWPADTYYADMVGTGWTDNTVDNTGANDSRNDNEKNDGKFDQNTIPSSVELEVGRVDLADMNRAPTSGVSEVSRLRRYLRQSHQFRHKLGAYWNIPRRSIIRDGFGHFNNGEAFAVQGWATALTAVGPTVDTPGSGQWFTPAFASGKDYLFGHGCGGGSSDTASGFGSSRDFGTKPSRVVFTSLFGSYFGDFGYPNTLMRAAICGNADGTSLGLTCFWSGRPNWFTHHPGMGETWGYSAKASMNAGLSGGGSYAPLASSGGGTHIALMGDPALRMHMTTPPRGLAATSSSGNVALGWAASTESAVNGYHVYRGPSADGPFTRLTTDPVTATTFTDTTAPAGGTLTYLVKTLRLDSVPGGSFHNLSIGSPVTITPSEEVAAAPANPSELEVMVSPATALVGFHKFDDSTSNPESADVAEPGFTATVTKSTESRNAGGSDDTYYGDSKIKSPNASDGFLRMTGDFTLTVNHGGTTPWLLDSLLLDAVTLSSGSLLNVSYSVNGGAPVRITATPLALAFSTDSTAVQPYGDFSVSIPGVTLNPEDTIVFTFSLAAGSARIDNIALAAKPPVPATTLDLAWTDNSDNETGFLIERKSSLTGTYESIGTVGANITRFTDTNVPYQPGVYFYRVTAQGTTNSTPSNEVFHEPIPGLVEFPAAVAKYDRNTGTAAIPVMRVSGSHGTASVSFATANSSATAGTHYTATTGTVTWQDGESGTKYINVPILPTPSFPRQFKVTLSSPTNGMGLGIQTSHTALMEDPAGTLDAPWMSAIFGTITHYSPAVTVDGAIGDAIIGGTAPVAAGTAESGHFIHQTRSGDGTLVMRVRGSNPAHNNARFGVMIRSDLATNAQMAVTLSSSNTSFGTKFLYRPTTGAATAAPLAADWPANTNNTIIACWVRITRMGDLFVSEVSADGTNWTHLASQTIPDFPASALWGIYHCADSAVVDYQLGVYENVALTAPPLPVTPGGFTIASTGTTGATLNWTAQAMATGHLVERRGDDGSQTTFSASGAGSHTDTTAQPDTSYEYRITAGNPGGNSPPTGFIRTTTSPAASAPLRPGFLDPAATPGTGIVLSWFDASANTGGVEIERKAIHGEWTPLHTLPSGGTAYSDTTILPGVHYHYRVRNAPAGQLSSWATRFPMPSAPPVVAPGTATGYQLWLLENQLPMDESGPGNATAMPADGSAPLLVKYALGLSPAASTLSGKLTQGTHQTGGQTYATLSFTQPDPLPSGITCEVERSPDLSPGSWRTDGVVLHGTTTQAGTVTSTYRLSESQSSGGKQFLRLKVTKH